MQFEEVLLHPYYNDIKEQCYKDEPGMQIERWIKNTIDDDESIPADKKADYYVSDRKINGFKKLLQEQTQDIMTQITSAGTAVAVIPTDVLTGEVVNTLDKAAPIKSILVRDTTANILKVSESFLNLLNATQERYMDLLKAAKDRGFTDPQEEKNIRGYIVELRNQFEFIFKATGNEEFARLMGAKRAEAQSKGGLSDEQQKKLKHWARKILAESPQEMITDRLAELEEILTNA